MDGGNKAECKLRVEEEYMRNHQRYGEICEQIQIQIHGVARNFYFKIQMETVKTCM